jgi:hypothetical protein
MGKTWERAEEIGLPEGTGLTLEKTWHVRRHERGSSGSGRAGAPSARRTARDIPNRSSSAARDRDQWKPGAAAYCCHDPACAADQTGCDAYLRAEFFRTDDGARPGGRSTGGRRRLLRSVPWSTVCVHKLLAHPEDGATWRRTTGVYRSTTTATRGRDDGNTALPALRLPIDPPGSRTQPGDPREGAEPRRRRAGRRSGDPRHAVPRGS